MNEWSESVEASGLDRRVSPGLSVVVASHLRPEALLRCIRGLTLGPEDEVIVVVRPDDGETIKALRETETRVRIVEVYEPGVLPAYREGIRNATRPLVALLDDDAIPMPGWVDVLRRRLLDPQVGMVGGLVRNFEGVRTSNGFFEGSRVTEVDVLGRPKSRLHELPARRVLADVDFLPGSNMAFRRSLVDLGADVLPGMAPGIEWLMALQVRRRGFRVVYDSSIQVEHHPAPRGEFNRNDSRQRAYDVSYASAVIASRYLPPIRRVPATLFCYLVGSRSAPGLAAGPIMLPRAGGPRGRWLAAQRGRWDAIRAHRFGS